MVVNTLLTAVQCIFMLAEPPLWALWQAILIVAVFAINARPILRGVMQVLRRGSGK